MTFTSVLSIFIIGSLLIYSEYRNFENEIDDLYNDYLNSQKNIIKKEVEHIIEFINYKKSNIKIRLKKEIKNRIYESCDILMNIYKDYWLSFVYFYRKMYL